MHHFRNLSVSEVLNIKYYFQAAGSGSPRAREWGKFRNLSVSEVLSIKCYFSGGALRHRNKTILLFFARRRSAPPQKHDFAISPALWAGIAVAHTCLPNLLSVVRCSAQ